MPLTIKEYLGYSIDKEVRDMACKPKKGSEKPMDKKGSGKPVDKKADAKAAEKKGAKKFPKKK